MRSTDEVRNVNENQSKHNTNTNTNNHIAEIGLWNKKKRDENPNKIIIRPRCDMTKYQISLQSASAVFPLKSRLNTGIRHCYHVNDCST